MFVETKGNLELLTTIPSLLRTHSRLTYKEVPRTNLLSGTFDVGPKGLEQSSPYGYPPEQKS